MVLSRNGKAGTPQLLISPNSVLANALLRSIDLLRPRVLAARPSRIEFVVGTQINGAPHLGTNLVQARLGRQLRRRAGVAGWRTADRPKHFFRSFTVKELVGEIHIRHRGAFAYVTGELTNGATLPLFRLRYNGSATTWGFAIYRASREGDEPSYLPSGYPSGTPQEALDCACGLYLNDPTAWQPPGARARRGVMKKGSCMIKRIGPRSTRLLKSAGGVLSAGSVAILLMAGSAHAAPLDQAPSELTGCRIEHGNHASASSICLGGTGEQRLVTNCTDGEKSDAGSWVGRGDRSSVNCGRGDVTGLRIEQRAAGTAPREQYTPN